MKISKFASARTAFAVLAFVVLAVPAWAAAPATPAPTLAAPAAPKPVPAAPAAPIFPPGSRVGLVPPPGMMLSKTFPGFVDPKANAGIIVSVLPAGAYADMEKTFTADALKKRGITLEKHESLQLSVGKGDLVVGTQLDPNKTLYRKWLLLLPIGDFTVAVTVQAPVSAKAYSDAVVRAALATLAVRAQVPKTEFLSLLPFTVGDLAGFQIANVIPGRALLLVDAPAYPHMVATQGLPEYEFDARTIIAAVPGGPSDTQDRINYARMAFGSIGGLKDIQMTMSEPVRINDQEGFETVAHAKDAANGSDVMVVQWLRFGHGISLQIVGISRAAIWSRELARLRTIRDSVAFR
jgi:hypothetical protein